MTKEEVIKKFVNSEEFYIIDDYISTPYIETINELQEKLDKINEICENGSVI